MNYKRNIVMERENGAVEDRNIWVCFEKMLCASAGSEREIEK
jgi:hypothetical protein